jgi:hypothetical protein
MTMLNKNQEQTVAEGGIAIQSGGSVQIIKNGLSYEEVRAAALDVFKANFYELAGEAREIASARAEEITTKFLSQIQKEFPDGIKKSADPDFQYALFNVQKQYARNGDKNLGDLLVDLLIDRSKQEQRDILQIVLNESLETAPKLTEQQLAVLSITFFSDIRKCMELKIMKLLVQVGTNILPDWPLKSLRTRLVISILIFLDVGQ